MENLKTIYTAAVDSLPDNTWNADAKDGLLSDVQNNFPGRSFYVASYLAFLGVFSGGYAFIEYYQNMVDSMKEVRMALVSTVLLSITGLVIVGGERLTIATGNWYKMQSRLRGWRKEGLLEANVEKE